jgi:hypothetical protein
LADLGRADTRSNAFADTAFVLENGQSAVIADVSEDWVSPSQHVSRLAPQSVVPTALARQLEKSTPAPAAHSDVGDPQATAAPHWPFDPQVSCEDDRGERGRLTNR